jgi:hypothetical protein
MHARDLTDRINEKFRECEEADQTEMKKLAPWKVPDTYEDHEELNLELPY